MEARNLINKLPLPGSPLPVDVAIPFALIDMAKCYPAIDWNEVMRYAVNSFDKHRAAQPEVRVADIAVDALLREREKQSEIAYSREDIYFDHD